MGCGSSHLAQTLDRFIGAGNGTHHRDNLQRFTQNSQIRLNFVVGAVFEESAF